MDTLKKLFPFSFRPLKGLTDLIIAVILLIVADAVCGVVIGLLSHLPLIGWIIGLVGGLLGLYFFVSIVLIILNYLKVLK